MAKDIYVDTGELSSRLLNKADDYIDTAQSNIKKVGTWPQYRGPDGYSALYTSGMMNELSSILRDLNAVESRIKKYAQLLNTGPDELAQVDKDQKNEITTWWERVCQKTGDGGLNITIGTPVIAEALLGLFTSTTQREGEDTFIGNHIDGSGQDDCHALAQEYTAGGGGYASSGGGISAFGGGSDNRYESAKEAAEKYSAGGGGYSSVGGGSGAFGSGSMGSHGVDKKDNTGNIFVDTWNDFSYGARWLEDKYNQLDEEERKLLEELGEEYLGEELYYALSATNDIATGDVSWDTLKDGLKAIGTSSVEVNVIIETCETVVNPTGTMETLMDGIDMFMESGAQKIVDGDIGGGLADWGMSLACGLCSIGYGIGEVTTEVISSTISSYADKITAPIGLVGKIIPGEGGEIIDNVADGISTVTDKVSGWISNLLQ